MVDKTQSIISFPQKWEHKLSLDQLYGQFELPLIYLWRIQIGLIYRYYVVNIVSVLIIIEKNVIINMPFFLSF